MYASLAPVVGCTAPASTVVAAPATIVRLVAPASTVSYVVLATAVCSALASGSEHVVPAPTGCAQREFSTLTQRGNRCRLDVLVVSPSCGGLPCHVVSAPESAVDARAHVLHHVRTHSMSFLWVMGEEVMTSHRGGAFGLECECYSHLEARDAVVKKGYWALEPFYFYMLERSACAHKHTDVFTNHGPNRKDTWNVPRTQGLSCRNPDLARGLCNNPNRNSPRGEGGMVWVGNLWGSPLCSYKWDSLSRAHKSN